MGTDHRDVIDNVYVLLFIAIRHENNRSPKIIEPVANLLPS